MLVKLNTGLNKIILKSLLVKGLAMRLLINVKSSY